MAVPPFLTDLKDDFQVTAYKAFRSYYIAQAFIASQKWGEAMAVFQRSLKYSAEVLSNTYLDPLIYSQVLF